MKKLLAWLLALMMLFTCAALAEQAEEAETEDMPLEAEENAYLSQEEIEIYLNVLAGDALAMGVENTEVNPETSLTTITYAGGATLRIADEELAANSAVLGAALTYGQEDLRGIEIGSSLADVLAVYPNDNPSLEGTWYDAALYIGGDKPEAAAGYVLREGQRITEIIHLVYTWNDDGVVRSGVSYALDHGTVTGISIFGLDQTITEADALSEITNIAKMQETREYRAYASDARGEGLTAFAQDDLALGGLSLTGLTADAAQQSLGQAPVDEWMQDSSGEYLRTLQWEGVSLVFVYDAQKNFLRLDSLLVNDDVIEGPRGVRIDDTMDSVMNRFLHGENTQLDNAIALYGDGAEAPYGVLAYGETTATITYSMNTDGGQNVIWQLTFQDGVLDSYVMLFR